MRLVDERVERSQPAVAIRNVDRRPGAKLGKALLSPLSTKLRVIALAGASGHGRNRFSATVHASHDWLKSWVAPILDRNDRLCRTTEVEARTASLNDIRCGALRSRRMATGYCEPNHNYRDKETAQFHEISFQLHFLWAVFACKRRRNRHELQKPEKSGPPRRHAFLRMPHLVESGKGNHGLPSRKSQ